MRDYEGLYHFLYDAVTNVLEVMRYKDYFTADFLLRSALQEADAHDLLQLPVEKQP